MVEEDSVYRVRPDVYMTALLDEIAERLLRIDGRLAEEEIKGFVYPINVEVKGLVVLNFTESHPFFPLSSVTLYNDGPDDVYPSVSAPQKVTPLKAGETVKFDTRKPKIAKLFLDVDAGCRAVVRGFGFY